MFRRESLQYSVIKVVEGVETNRHNDDEGDREHNTQKTPVDDAGGSPADPPAFVYV